MLSYLLSKIFLICFKSTKEKQRKRDPLIGKPNEFNELH